MPRGVDQLRRQRVKWWHENPYCFYCGRLTRLPTRDWPAPREFQPDDMATIDHLRSKFHPQRHEPGGTTIRRVLACLRCNMDRAREEELAAGVEELRRRSENGHKNEKAR